MIKTYVTFTSTDRRKWLGQIEKLKRELDDGAAPRDIMIGFDASIIREALEPLHLVTLACLIHYFREKGHDVYLANGNENIRDYIYYDLDFSAYWPGGLNHVDAHKSQNIFNLWRIVEEEKDLYSMYVENYFKRNYFRNKDLSAVSVSLAEAYYNVFDHANAGGNAFSLLKYDEPSGILHVVIADFGCGIPDSVRTKKPDLTDVDALDWALKDHSTVQSTFRNKGFGMSNILNVASAARIFSGNALMAKGLVSPELYVVDFSFPGTLIYLEIDLNSFEEEVVLDEFEI